MVAAANRSDPDHDACLKLLSSAAAPLIIPDLIVCEAAYLIARHLGGRAEAAFLRSLTSSDVRLEPLLLVDLTRMAELVEQYTNLRLGATDASVIAIAERLGLTAVATVDRRHFSVVRCRHTDCLELCRRGSLGKDCVSRRDGGAAAEVTRVLSICERGESTCSDERTDPWHSLESA